MERKPLTHPRRKKYSFLSVILLAAVMLGMSCHKSKNADPCEGVLSEGTPLMAGLIFIDKQTNELLLLSRNIDPATITITPVQSDIPAEKGAIVNQVGSPVHGALLFHVNDTKKGTFSYKITIPGVGSTMLSYTNQELKQDNPCHPYYIATVDTKIEDHPYTVTFSNAKLVFKITI
ncbi:hypothetical protein CLV59_108129 [Chitinophaga dinghuensis]|uniref:Lipoprotein n=1 Tax=Chitinophaga dinghuensis TaxID=1539050 RepID=A0A327VRD8_9BACT|nr:hypothetical protein [Chitinophaga dinghuensis]RAJ76610.1 hypothetical protein CLV59_108129 [Chitinophaga dinghuensis]